MTGTFNKIIIFGHLGANPDIHVTSDGREIARFNVATSDRYKDKNGEKQEHTEWHRVVAFRSGLIDSVIKPFLKKGSKVLIEGSSRTGKYTDKDGVERYSTDVIVDELTLSDRPEKRDQ